MFKILSSREDNFVDLDNEDQLESITSFEWTTMIDRVRMSQEELTKENMLLEKYLQAFGLKKKFQASEGIKELEKVKIVGLKESITEITAKFAPFPEMGIIDITSTADLSESISIMTSLTEDSIATKTDVILPLEEKCEIAASQIREMTEKLTKLHRNWFMKLSPFKVKMEEIALHNRELQQDISNFRRDVTVNPVSGKIMLEKVNLYFTRSIKAKEIQTERCRLEHDFLKSLERKMEKELKQNQEMSGSMGEINYNELKIENAQYVEKVEDKNQVLLSVKRHMNITLQVLRTYKLKLQQLIEQNENLKKEVQRQKENIINIEKEIEECNEVKSKTERAVRHLNYQLQNYRVPDVMDYVKTQAEVFELKKLINIWKRRVTIAERSFNAKSKVFRRGRKRQSLLDEDFYR